MIELKQDKLEFSFSEVHPSARVTISLQRTLRIPDDGKNYPLPPGLGNFPLVHTDDYAKRVPASWAEHGGVVLPMYQSEAMWIRFTAHRDEDRDVNYPFAIKVATGKINAVSGFSWEPGLNRTPRQDYVVVPRQPWLDGYCVEKGVIRQFVAMPLGGGYTAEEQVSGKAEHGGLQIMAMPMKREVFERRFPIKEKPRYAVRYCFEGSPGIRFAARAPEMGLAPGGRMKQEIYEDSYELGDWDLGHNSRCFVHIANSMVWRQITGRNPPTVPPTAEEYNRRGLPWYDYYSDAKAIDGSLTLACMQSVDEVGKEKGAAPLPENQGVLPFFVVDIHEKRNKDQVIEFSG